MEVWPNLASAGGDWLNGLASRFDFGASDEWLDLACVPSAQSVLRKEGVTMARQARGDLFSADEVAVVHVMNRVHHGEYLLGKDDKTKKDYSYRRGWFLKKLRQLIGGFALDLLAHAIMENHFHLIVRSRPDIVKYWSDSEVARRWLLICPKRKTKDGRPKPPNEKEINALKGDKAKIKQLRSRLSDISWLVRLLCQYMAQRVNAEYPEPGGKFFDNRYKAVRLLDEAALVACSIYVDSNPIRAALCEVLEQSQYASIQHRLTEMVKSIDVTEKDFSLSELYAKYNLPCITDEEPSGQAIDATTSEEVQTLLMKAFEAEDSHLAPVSIDEKLDPIGPHISLSPYRCSDKGYLSMPYKDYLELLDWSVRQTRADKRGSTPMSTPPILERLKLAPDVWCELITQFDKLFSLVAGLPEQVDKERGKTRGQRFHMKSSTRELLSRRPAPSTASAASATTTITSTRNTANDPSQPASDASNAEGDA